MLLFYNLFSEKTKFFIKNKNPLFKGGRGGKGIKVLYNSFNNIMYSFYFVNISELKISKISKKL